MGYLTNDGRIPPLAKLKPSEVMDIKIMHERLVKRMAEKYNISRATIRKIYLEKIWRHVRLKKAP